MSKKIKINGVEHEPATAEQLANLVAKTAVFNSETMPLLQGDTVKFLSADVFAKQFQSTDYATYAAEVTRNGETLQGFISQSALQAMNLTTQNPIVGTEKFEQVNQQFSGLNCVELGEKINGKTFSITKLSGNRVADWIDGTEKKANGSFRKVPKTALDTVNGKPYICTKTKEYNVFN